MKGGNRAWELAPEQVRKVTDASSLMFETASLLPVPPHMVGQSRAQEAVDFALEIADGHYNLYVSGEPGTGRMTSVMAAVRRIARGLHAGQDWCYVHNFDVPGEPIALSLPAGMGRTLSHDVDMFVVACRRELRRAFGGDNYRRQRLAALTDVESRHRRLLEELQQEAVELGFAIQGTPSGLVIIPLSPPAPTSGAQGAPEDDSARNAYQHPLTPEAFEALSPEQQEEVRASRDRVQAAIERVLPQVRALEEEARTRVRKLDHDIAETAVRHLADDLLARYATLLKVVNFIQHLKLDIVAHADVLRGASDNSIQPERGGPDERMSVGSDGDSSVVDAGSPVSTATGEDVGSQGDAVPLDEDFHQRPATTMLLRRYRVNVVVSRESEDQAPVVQVMNPTYLNLLGHIEFGLRDGLPYTDHTMIKAGALHRANGGFLTVQAQDLLSRPHSWEAVKRVLRFALISIESNEELQSIPASASLRPEPIPASVKVILIGDPGTYAALVALDPEFRELFKVRADFDSEMTRTPETEQYYAQIASDVTHSSGYPPLTREAVALLVEEGSRWVEDQERLSSNVRDLRDLAVEAGYWAKKEGSLTTDRAHVAKAIAAGERRLSLIPDKLDAMISQGTVMIDTDGQVVGQVNGLTVMTVGDYVFGKPARITARTSPGMAGVVNIEREVMMSGPSHTKGILILTGYLSGRFAQDYPLSLSASVCFEQVYGEIEGDSASSAELYALLSSLAAIPIKQSLAVTGSVNQRGEVQAVGGVTHKVEGFFNLCAARGLTGEQGVIIPRANVRNLMLREEVVEAIRADKFHVYAVSTIDDGIELLTGMPAGRPDRDGRYLEGTINARVSRALRQFSERVRAFGTPLAGQERSSM